MPMQIQIQLAYTTSITSSIFEKCMNAKWINSVISGLEEGAWSCPIERGMIDGFPS